MDRLIMQRAPLRQSFDSIVSSVEDYISENIEYDIQSLTGFQHRLADKFKRLEELQQRMDDLLLDDPDITPDKFNDEANEAEMFRDRFHETKANIETILKSMYTTVSNVPGSTHSSRSDMPEPNRETFARKRVLYPEMSLRKFNGDIKDWLGFWTQFEKIHLSGDLAAEDKFYYLLQSMVPGSRAARLLASFPPTAENYGRAVEQLKNRFGRDDLLIEVYVRELQSLVIDNAVGGQPKTDVTSLYDKLETYLNALDTLGCKRDKTAVFLTPLVESALPEELLRLWERKKSSDGIDMSDYGLRLDNLMHFLRNEVNNEELCKLARAASFTSPSNERSNKFAKKCTSNVQDPNSATASSLINTEERATTVKSVRRPICVFCEKTHLSQDCYASKKIPLEEKRQLLISKNCCHSCLKKGHHAKQCRLNVRCIVCDGRHYPVMCPNLNSKGRISCTSDEILPDEKISPVSEALFNQTSREEVYLKTLVVRVENGRKSELVRAFIDNGSQRSYVTAGLAKRLQLPASGEETTSHGLFGGESTPPIAHKIYKVTLSNVESEYRCNFDVREQSKICGVVPLYEHLPALPKQVKLTPWQKCSNDIEVLIGADVSGRFLTGKMEQIPGGLTAVETKLGWTLMGLTIVLKSQKNNLTHMALNVLDVSIADLWKMDVLGITDPLETQSRAESEKKTLQKFHETTSRLNDGRYEVHLPFKESHQCLSENKELAFKRNQTVRKRLANQNVLQEYSSIFDEWTNTGIIEKVPVDQLECYGHYLPHRPVIKEGSQTTKIRPVFDASARGKGSPSLNDCLETGPNLIELIPNVLDRFREKAIGVSSDIEKAFLQIGIAKEHRDYLRFYHLLNDQVYRHCRVVFGVTSSPFLLSAVLDYHLANVPNEFQAVAEHLRSSFYVDNCITSVNSETELQHFIVQSSAVLYQAGFNLRDWRSNRATENENSTCTQVALLGLTWNTERDTLKCNLSHTGLGGTCITKRSILSATQKIFDPLGILCPVLLFPKRLLQELWQLEIGWDDPVPEQFSSRFERWESQLHLLEQLEIPRYFGNVGERELHVFVDASQEAYAACAFLHFSSLSQTIVTYVRAKSRVAPTKRVAIPRLELIACCIGVRLAISIKQSLRDENLNVVYWTDAMTALWWIHGNHQWATFVSNRVKEIRQYSDPSQWRHCPGDCNPADLPSRGCTPIELLSSKWWEGPTWLLSSSHKWPMKQAIIPTRDAYTEARKSVVFTSLSVTEVPWYLRYFSNYHRIIRMVAWIRRFINNARGERDRGPLNLTEIAETETIVFRKVQCERAEKLQSLGRNVLTQDENGVYRMKTPILSRDDKEAFLKPVVLPGDHPLVVRLVEYQHLQHSHAGTELLLGILRENYWILGARRAIRKTVKACKRCLRYNSKPITTPSVGLPQDRVRDAHTFEITGLDLAGPVFLRSNQKAWIVIFTCAVYRAIHLELVISLSIKAFLQALRRFVARRGRPSVIYSDNGTNLVGACNALAQLDWDKITRETEVSRIVWKFNPPSSPWWGRMIRTVKTLLRSVLGRALLSYEEMQTVLINCESVVNARPLTHLNEDRNELVALTPSMFLRDLPDARVADLDRVDYSSDKLRRRLPYRQHVYEVLRQRFRTEYLGQLKQQSRNQQEHRPLRVGELVLVGQSNQRRLDWPLAKVTCLYPGRDGVVRRVQVLAKGSSLMRPIQKIYPLELRADTSEDNQKQT